MKQIIINYTFSASAKTITLSDFSASHPVDLKRLYLITDVTTNKILYSFADATVSSASISSNNIVTLSALQGGESNTDALQVVYEALSTDPYYETPLSIGAPATSGGLSQAAGSIGATVTSIKSSAGQVYGWFFYNNNSAQSYVQFFNVASGSVVLGTTTPVYSLPVPGYSGANVFNNIGLAHSTAITIAITTTRTGSTAPTNTVDYNIFYA